MRWGDFGWGHFKTKSATLFMYEMCTAFQRHFMDKRHFEVEPCPPLDIYSQDFAPLCSPIFNPAASETVSVV